MLVGHVGWEVDIEMRNCEDATDHHFPKLDIDASLKSSKLSLIATLLPPSIPSPHHHPVNSNPRAPKTLLPSFPSPAASFVVQLSHFYHLYAVPAYEI